uniref:Uncharacterized protein n=1 Tax=Guillardia theta TaxID=55529 RepID=A0A6U6CAU5_GUITH|mmetsp:Transcript_43233/g.136703  ORF Transcript_43233/g.136703 Transcript_43233/m.136703 type:complete len:145 (+) Transcript_43233:111-545(+)
MATSEFANGNQDNFYSRKFRSIQSGDAVPYRCYCPIAPIKYSGHKPMMSLECIDVKPYSRHMAPAVSYPRFLDQRTERLSTGMSSYSKLVSPFPRHDMDQLKAPTLQARPPASSSSALMTLAATRGQVADPEPGEQVCSDDKGT